tara:strand:- start:430 stop:555 length:126 start_codon:yes stop_codon:yes gene_type:complete
MNFKSPNSTLNGTKTLGSVSLRYTILANYFCPLKWALVLQG